MDLTQKALELMDGQDETQIYAFCQGALAGISLQDAPNRKEIYETVLVLETHAFYQGMLAGISLQDVSNRKKIYETAIAILEGRDLLKRI